MKHSFKYMLKPALIYTGIIMGIVILQTIVADVAGFSVSKANRWLGFAILIGAIIYSIYGYRKEYLDNQITYGQAFGFGVFVSFLVGLLSSTVSYLYTHYVSPELLEQGRIMAEEMMIKRGLSDAQIERGLANQTKFDNLPFIVATGTIVTTLIGLITSAIAASFLKKEPKNPFEGVE